ncbi:MAG: hypothetical protein COV59_03420 [Candidatus Magasanikbacteria bacterium CG11_big_fil_rev_8_21_14_0_20_39_34]|uniref:Uncharacterized protein n=1 Tax=Candidatus Magasanikbacteria bacterium CG11_big_fil_rev_8_21_14_0_20_39_34 TaxID=1974653 RepID=A0A2H0N5P1_9BACT|nr:MAG: hypothetical protein COV59_03420 [Candidatus Magasanikbacteria bacterium CG11_big_fil_rev_8_21_14_0_20_39_34]
MKKTWFEKSGWIYPPISFEGTLMFSLCILFCFHIFFFFDQKSQSISDTLYAVFPYVPSIFLFYTWITSEKEKK